jgi:pimeloyl-ACP methyl ester carboxylesterase/tetratricopeptide (TPR) repeat protein
LDGSVRRAGGRVRVVANMHDALSGVCLWSQRYDRDVEDVFTIQDEIARQIAANLAGAVAGLAESRARAKRPENMVAYDYFLRGLFALGHYRIEELKLARTMFEQALRLDPNYAAPMFGLAQVHINRWFLDADESALDDAYDWAMKALGLDPDDAWCAMIAGRVLLHRRDFTRARYYYERAIDLNPSCADILSSYSYLLVCLGRGAEAVCYAREAIRLNPHRSGWYDENLGNALFARGDYEDAFHAFQRVPDPPAYVHGYMAAALARLGRLDEARAAAAHSVALDPTQSIERHRRGEPFQRPEDMDDLLDALRLAGLPETHVREPTAISARAKPTAPPPAVIEQTIRHCMTRDGVRLALATVGQGPPLVRPGNWLTHLEYDRESPVWRHWIRELARDRTLVRYDERGNGLSDWRVEDLSFEALVDDLETIVDHMALERFPLFGASRGAAVALAYAARHPERVMRIVLYGGFARGWARRGSTTETERRSGLAALIEDNWGQDNPWFRQAFTSLFIPEATSEQMTWFNELQRRTISPRNARIMQEVSGTIDVTDLLPRIAAPTLIVHAREDAVVPFAEGRLLADRIPGARFVALEGRNHILLESEPAWSRFLVETRAFLNEDR